MRRAFSILAATSIAACGGTSDDAQNMRIGFRQHALTCEIKDIQAKMQITGVPGFCMLEVDEETRTVGGLCPKVPTGMPRAFRLIYFVEMMTTQLVEVQLATVIETLDLTNETRSLVTLEFSSDEIDTIINDDNDELTNIEEVCMGRNPLLMDQ